MRICRVRFNIQLDPRVSVAISFFAYIFLLNCAYILLCQKFSFNYFIKPSYDKWAVSIVMSMLPVWFIRPLSYQFAHFVVFFIYVLVYVPACFIPLYLNQLPWWTFFCNVMTLMVCLWILNCVSLVRFLNIQRTFFAGRAAWNIFLILLIAWFVFFLFYFAQYLHFVSFENVYVRRQNIEFMWKNSAFFAYTAQWLQNSICPFLVIYGLAYRRSMSILIGVLGLLVLYMVTANKVDVFALIVLLVTYLLVVFLKKKPPLLRSSLLISFVSLMILIVILVDLSTGELSLTNWFVRRPIVDTGLMTAWHWIYFSSHPHGYWFCSTLSFLNLCPYPFYLNYQVGFYFSGVNQNADVNFWGAAYANMGNLGVFFYTGILFFLLVLFNELTKNMKSDFTATLAIWVAYSLSGTDLFVMLLTSGVAILVILCYIFRRFLSVQDQSIRESNENKL